MRYLLVNHPIAVCVALFIAVMVAIRYGLAPYIVENFGVAGVVGFVGLMLALGFMIDRRDAH